MIDGGGEQSPKEGGGDRMGWQGAKWGACGLSRRRVDGRMRVGSEYGVLALEEGCQRGAWIFCVEWE